jgi:cytochrome c oxidase subunit 2
VGLTVAAVALALFSAAFPTWVDMETPPAHPYTITVTAQPWIWHFTYPNGHVDTALHLPVNRPVLLRLAARDAAYTLSIPAFRVRKGLVPGREDALWFEATRPGTYDAICARYAGDGTAEMVAPVTVHKRGELESWLKSVSDFLSTLPPAEAGRKLYQIKGCVQCHSLDGTRKTGPSFKGIFGHEVELADGSTVVVDKDYIHESILDPKAKVVKGFEPVMPPFAGRVSDKEIEAIAAFIESLSDHAAATKETSTETTP